MPVDTHWERAKLEPPAPYSNTDTAEVEAINTLRSLLDPRRVKADLRERDKFPNSDGYLELVDDQGRPCGKIEVQIKTIPSAAMSLACRGSLVGYTAVTALPVILVGVDPAQSRAYWVHISHLMPGYKADQRTFTVHFTDADYIDKTPACPCYHQWLELAREYQARVQLPAADRILPPSVARLTTTQIEALQQFIDTVNTLLDHDFATVKALLFPGIWKFAVGCRPIEQDLVFYQLLRVPSGRPAPLIVELPESVRPLELGDNVQTAMVMSRDPFFHDPKQHGRQFVFKMLRHLVRTKALPLHTAEMAAEIVFDFIRRYHHWLEIEPDRDSYRLDELRLAFGPHLSRKVGSVAALLPITPSGVRVVNLDSIHELSSVEVPGNYQQQAPAIFALVTNTFPLNVALQAIKLFSALGVSTIGRRFRGADLECQPPPDNFIWSCYSRQREIQNVVAILECVVSEYESFIRSCAFNLQDSPYLNPATAIVFDYVSAYDSPAGTGPSLHEYRLRNADGALPKTTVLATSVNRNHDRANCDSRMVIGGVPREVECTISRSADFFFQGTPLLDFVYRLLADDLKRKYAIDVHH